MQPRPGPSSLQRASGSISSPLGPCVAFRPVVDVCSRRRLVRSAALPEVGSSSSSPAAATAASAATAPAPASTPVAPSSDVQTRQLRLLPWQTSASVGATSGQAQGSGVNGNASSKASSRERDAGAGGAAAASTSAPTTSTSSSSRLRRLPPASTGSTGAAASSSSSPAIGDAASSSGSSSMRLTPRPLAAPCESCGGKRFVLSSRGVQPCYTCQQWRQRPDFQPAGSLLMLQDVDMGTLSGSGGAGTSTSGEAPTAADGGGAGTGSGVGGDGGASGRKARRRAGPMSAERKQAISKALQSKGAKSEEHKRSISRAMREAHARNPQLRHSAAGQKKKCGHCGQEGHNRKTCPQLLAAAAAAEAAAATAAAATAAASSGRGAAGSAARLRPAAGGAAGAGGRMIVIEEVDASALLPDIAAAVAAAAAAGGPSNHAGAAAQGSSSHASSAAGGAAAAGSSSDGNSLGSPAAADAAAMVPPPPPVSVPSYGDALPVLRLGPCLALSPEGGWVFPMPHSKEECVAQAAQASLRAWDDGIRRQAVELLLPQAHPTEDGGWPGGIRQQFRVAKPMVESLLLRLKEHAGLGGRITAEFLDEGDCVGAWQSERLAAVLFATADTLPDLRRIDDALSGERLTIVINPQWQTQGQVISDFGIGKARKSGERFVAGFEDIYYLRRVRIFGDDVRIMRCYPGQWQVHYVPPDPRAATILLSCEDSKPTFERLIELLKTERGSRASKTWLDRFLTSSMGTFNEFGAFSEAAAAAAMDGFAGGPGGGWPGDAASSTAAAQRLAAAAAVEQQQQEALRRRDIVTGEVLPAGSAGSTGGGSDDAAPQAASSSSRSRRSKDGSSMRLEPVRDVRMEPVNQIAKWLGSQPHAGEGRHEDAP